MESFIKYLVNIFLIILSMGIGIYLYGSFYSNVSHDPHYGKSFLGMSFIVSVPFYFLFLYIARFIINKTNSKLEL